MLAGVVAGVVIWTGGFYWLNVKTMCLGSSMIYTTKWQQQEGNVGPDCCIITRGGRLNVHNAQQHNTLLNIANIFLCVQIFFCAGDERQYGVLLPAAARLRLKLRPELGHAGHGVSRQPVLLQVTPSHHRE